MTNLEALTSIVGYEHDQLLEKALIDQGVTAGATYAAADEQDIDMSAADVYLYLSSHPELKEGSFSVKMTSADLLNARKTIYDKYGLELPEVSGGSNHTINGTALW